MGEARLLFHRKKKSAPPPEPEVNVIYGVEIDETNTNPTSAVSYIEDSIGFDSALGAMGSFYYGSWKNNFPFNKIKPCVFKDGQVQYYLNPNDYTQKEDGSPADITSYNGTNVMVEFPKIYWKFTRVGTKLQIRYSNYKADSGFMALAHTRNGVEKDKTYIGAYTSVGDDTGTLRSVSGKASTTIFSYNSHRDASKENGAGYEQMTYFHHLMIQVLFTVMFKSRDSVESLGYGYVGSKTAPLVSGTMDKKGMFYGNVINNQYATGVKFCGLENIYGNLAVWLDGIVFSDTKVILTSDKNFNNTGSLYEAHRAPASNTVSSRVIQTVMGETKIGFVPDTTSGTGATAVGYVNRADAGNSRVMYVGGNYSSPNKNAGIYTIESSTLTTTGNKATSRLTYL